MSDEENVQGEAEDSSEDSSAGTVKFKNNAGKTVEVNADRGNLEAAVKGGLKPANKACEKAIAESGL